MRATVPYRLREFHSTFCGGITSDRPGVSAERVGDELVGASPRFVLAAE
jgi:hypothetical protein